jgi:hypothetical protein
VASRAPARAGAGIVQGRCGFGAGARESPAGRCVRVCGTQRWPAEAWPHGPQRKPNVGQTGPQGRCDMGRMAAMPARAGPLATALPRRRRGQRCWPAAQMAGAGQPKTTTLRSESVRRARRPPSFAREPSTPFVPQATCSQRVRSTSPSVGARADAAVASVVMIV